MKKALPYLLSILFGFLIWAGSLPITGNSEPWDGGLGYYTVSLFLAGLVTGFGSSVKPIKLTAGIFVGQLLWIILDVIRGGEATFILIGLVFLAAFSLISYVGAKIGAEVSPNRFE